MTTITILLLGCVGGLLPDVLRIVKNRHNSSLPDYFKQPMFWLGWFLLVLLGGFAAWLLTAQDAKQAVAFGFAAPELLSNLGAKPEEPGRTDIDRGDRGEAPRQPFKLRSWWQS